MCFLIFADDVAATEAAANNFKSNGGRILAFGIGANVDEVELRKIASSDDDVFIVIDFFDLSRRLNDVFRC